MRLKSVELFGFKSFPDRTVIDFGQGITAILGPNGCGKSNVVDAIKWVLGEKSAKNLRGDEMLDVIFSGCESRKPSGMAEVKLNFDNTDQTLSLPYNEISVGRRIYRSRESEYFINNNRCRLKDIRDLFLDTGIGNSAYSVIEQGRVEELLHAKPAERRAVFEEAAGIAKFKVKRKEIISRLERTEQILLRVNDRVEEKERQIKKVSAQAANARRHRRLTAERDAVRKHLYSRQFSEQVELLRKLAAQREELEKELDSADAALAGLNEEFTALTREEAELTSNRDAVVEAAGKTQEELSGIQLGLAGERNRIEALTADIERGNVRRDELSSRLARVQAQETAAAAALTEAEEKATELDARFEGQDRDRQGLIELAAAAEGAVTLLRNQTIDLNLRRQELAATAARLESAEQSAGARRAEIDERMSKLSGEETAVATAVAGLEGEYQTAAEKFGATADRLEAIRGQARDLSQTIESLQREERAAEAERAGKASRKATLEDLENSFDGAFEGVKNILTASRDGDRDCRGVVGMALDLMTVPQDLALAVETILGGSAQDVVVESARDAQTAIEYLKRNRLGRATFLPMDRIQPRRRLTQNLGNIPGVVGEAVDLVQYDSRYGTVMEYLLAGILVVDNLGLARELSAREARGVKIVTLEGDVVSPSGAMTGGHGRQRRGGLVQRKAELDAVTAELADCERRLAEKARARGAAGDAAARLAREAAELEAAMAEVGRAEAGIKESLAVKKSELARIRRDSEEAARERDGLDAGGSRRAELEQLRRDLADSDGEMTRLEADVVAKTDEQRRTRAAIDALGQEFAALSGERSAALSRVRELRVRIGEFHADIESCREELARPGLSISDAEVAIVRHRAALTALAEREEAVLRVRDEHRAAATELAERLAECRSRSEALRQRERDGQTQTARLREGLSLLDRQTAESEMRLTNAREKAWEELGVELTAPVAPAPGVIEVDSDGGMAAPVEETAAEPPSEFDNLSDADLQARAEDLAQKIRNIGTVNPDAIDELAELEAGAEFLRSHKEEQEEAVAAMRTAIDRLNEESASRFQTTFAAVRENFQQMFTRLFGGGRADLVLEESTEPGADPLDAGIDISAQPPGKEPKSISLLSGGEKALCAVALLFALFRSKPSPFCILDEVDGPLDESNIDRFMQQVKDFTDETQFIIITHSQRTMGMTDEIWGVSQKVAGISSLTSLKFDAMESMSREKPVREAEEHQAAASA